MPTPVHVLHVVTRAAHDAVVAPHTWRSSTGSAGLADRELHTGRHQYVTNACSESVLGENAWLEHVRVQREGSKAWHIGLSRVDQQRDSHYRSFTLNMGGRLARHDLQAKLNAPSIETLLYGLYLTRGEQLVDNHTTSYHDHPNCNSWEVYKGVLAEKSRAVFNGKVYVRAEAQKTEPSRQSEPPAVG